MTTLSAEDKNAWVAKWLKTDKTQPKLMQAAHECRRLLSRFCQHQNTGARSVTLAGEVGCGKTHMATNAYHFAAGIRMQLLFMTWQESAPSVEFTSWSKIANDKGVIEDRAAINFLVVDDIGRETDEFKSGVPLQNFVDFLEERHRRNRWTIYTTNVPPNKFASRWDARVERRLYDGGVVCDLGDLKDFQLR